MSLAIAVINSRVAERLTTRGRSVVSVAMLTRSVVPVSRSRTKASAAKFVSFGTRLVALELNPT